MDLESEVKTLIENIFPYLKQDPEFSSLFVKFIINYSLTHPQISFDNILAIHYNIDHLHGFLEVPFKIINKLKQKGTLKYYYDRHIYEIKFTSEAEIYVDDELIQDWAKNLTSN